VTGSNPTSEQFFVPFAIVHSCSSGFIGGDLLAWVAVFWHVQHVDLLGNCVDIHPESNAEACGCGQKPRRIVIVATTAEGTCTVLWFVSIAEYWYKVEAGVQYGL
jgi:hypothetical protein